MATKSETWNEDVIAKITNEFNNSLDEKTHAVALKNLSKVLMWGGKNEEAKRLNDLASAMLPEDGEAQAQEGILLWRAGDREGALVHLRKAVQLSPLNPVLHHKLGILLSELNQLTEARAALEEAIRLDPTMLNVHYDYGIVLQELGYQDLAETAYRTDIMQNPNHAEAYNNLGTILGRRGNNKAAYELFSKAVQLDPNYKAAADNLARARKALGQ
jgi:Flp pilus assembly protein TadD